jgi:Predicted nucleic acid-binding protein, contains PIN domain
MGLIKRFNNKKIFVDTAPLIYYIEENPFYSIVLNDLFETCKAKNNQFVSSVITLIEVLVLPLREGKKELAETYKKILTDSRSIDIIDVNAEISEIAANIRANNCFKTPDAIQLATAIYSSSDYFLTNDKRLKSIKEVDVITIDELFNG